MMRDQAIKLHTIADTLRQMTVSPDEIAASLDQIAEEIYPACAWEELPRDGYGTSWWCRACGKCASYVADPPTDCVRTNATFVKRPEPR